MGDEQLGLDELLQKSYVFDINPLFHCSSDYWKVGIVSVGDSIAF
jgi:hypothetical protein